MVATAPGGLPGPGAPVSVEPVDDQDDLLVAADQQRLTGPLLWCAARGIVELDHAHVERLGELHVGALADALRIESRLWSILGWLEPLSVSPLVIKGPAVAHLDEIDPALRCFGDLDLLARPDELATVLGVLGSHGAVRPFAERRPGFDRRFAKSVTVTFPDGIEIDVHRTICDGVHGVRVPVDRLHADPETFQLGGRTVGAPDLTVRALHAAYHAVLGSPSPRLLSQRDLLGHLGRAEAEGGIDELADEAERWRGTAVLAQAVRETIDLPAVDLPGWRHWLGRTPIPAAEEAIVAAQRRDGSSFGRSRLTAARELPTARLRAAYLLAATVPGTRHLRSRGRSRLDALNPGPPTGHDPVVLPDLPPDRPPGRSLIVCRSFPWTDDTSLPDAHDPRAAPHVVVRQGAAQLRERWWRNGRRATVTQLPDGRGWTARLRRVATASGEVRRADPDVVVVERPPLLLVAPALLSGRRRVVDVIGTTPTGDGPTRLRGRVERWLEAAIRRRHRPGVGVAPGLH